MSRTFDGAGAVDVRGIRKTTSPGRPSTSRARTSSSVANKIRSHNPPKAIAAASRGGIQRRKV